MSFAPSKFLVEFFHKKRVYPWKKVAKKAIAKTKWLS